MNYIHENYGRDALVDYLMQFAGANHGTLKQKLRSEGIKVLSDYFLEYFDDGRGACKQMFIRRKTIQ
jgi:hypothetical protein